MALSISSLSFFVSTWVSASGVGFGWSVVWEENWYLGSVDAGRAYHATELIGSFPKEHQVPILIDQGCADGFLANQLLPKNLTAAAAEAGYKPITLRMQPGYDHSYYFISTFMKDHIDHHATALGLRAKL